MAPSFEPFNEEIRLTAKPHAFEGAILPPKHARELTPQQCLAMASALSEQQRKTVVPYTVWITEAWKLLGWAEPSAALFWELATMYHTLYWATRTAEEMESGFPPILSCGSTSSMGSANNSSDRANIDKRRVGASAKELPVWLVGIFLLLHCEDFAYQRNLSGEEEGAQPHVNPELGRKISHLTYATRTRLHGGWSHDHRHCTAYLLRHLRKFLILLAVPDNPDAVRACMHLAAIPPTPSATGGSGSTYSSAMLRRQHDEEHGNVGLGVRLQPEDLDRLQLVLQPPGGGAIDEPTLNIGALVWNALFQSAMHPGSTILLGDVEQEMRRHLEWDLMQEKPSTEEDNVGIDDVMSRLQIQDHKELSYHRLRGKTVLLKPEQPSSGASLASNDVARERLHDLSITECADAHIYLLQPFEHATIAGCSNCTIVVGAVAGLLHVVDCERTEITCATRRVLVSNSLDALIHLFSPSPPLLVGDNRGCQFAPYNTYYDGFREDLLATGLAAAVVNEGNSSAYATMEGGWPPLQTASNKWRQPMELSKVEVPQVPGSPSASSTASQANAAADDKAMENTNMPASVLLPASEFHILYAPLKLKETEEDEESSSQYCRFLADVLHLSPFRLPVEFERRVLVKAERMKNVQTALKSLGSEQRSRLEEELNQGFREWLVKSGNLRQVLDLVHMERSS